MLIYLHNNLTVIKAKGECGIQVYSTIYESKMVGNSGTAIADCTICHILIRQWCSIACKISDIILVNDETNVFQVKLTIAFRNCSNRKRSISQEITTHLRAAVRGCNLKIVNRILLSSDIQYYCRMSFICQ